MELKNILRNKNVYFDSNIFIYLLEGNDELSDLLADIKELIANRDIGIFSTALAYTELIPPHAKQRNNKGIESAIEFLDSFNLIAPNKEILIHAGVLRGETGMKTPDAIHVATAIASSCDIFLSNDKNIRVPQNIQRVIFSDHLRDL